MKTIRNRGVSVRSASLATIVVTASSLACLELSASPATSLIASLPRVLVIATGGTIAARHGERLTGEQLLKLVPDAMRYATVDVEQYANVDSNALTLVDCLKLARHMNDAFARQPELAGVVLTIGTDTLDEVAYFLNLTVRVDRPLAVVGAMRMVDALGYDGAANLLAAIRVAAVQDSRGKGVLVVLNDEINASREVAKTDAVRLQAFDSRSYGVLGVVGPDRVVYYRSPTKRHTVASEFDVAQTRTLPRVDILTAHVDAPGDLIRASVDAGAQGIVIAGTGAGNTTASQADGIAYAVRKGVVVAFSSRTGAGRVVAEGGGWAVHRPNGTDWQSSGHTVFAADLSPLKARILLTLALTRTHDGAEIQRMFFEY